MVERIFKNWKTTLVGLLILGVALYTVVSKIATWGQAAPGLLGLFAVFFKSNKDEQNIIREIRDLDNEKNKRITDIGNDSNDELDGKLSNWRKGRQPKN